MKAQRIKPERCPNCGHTLDEAAEIRGGRKEPKEGDYSVCINCGVLLRFGPGLTLGLVKDSDRMELEPELKELLLAASAKILERGQLS